MEQRENDHNRILLKDNPFYILRAMPTDRPEELIGRAEELELLTGVKTEDGMRFCQGDEGLYRTILEEYLQGAEAHMANLRKYYEAGDWKNYGIQVHTLKSTSRTIGAESLSAMAAELEKASNREDEEVIRRMHGIMMQEYLGFTGILARHMPEVRKEPKADGILEFLPE